MKTTTFEAAKSGGKVWCIVDDLDVVIVKNLSMAGADHRLYDVLKHHPSASIGLTQDYSEEYTEAGEAVPLSPVNLR